MDYYLTNYNAHGLKLCYSNGETYLLDQNYKYGWNQSPGSGLKHYILKEDKEYHLKGQEDNVDFALVGGGDRLGIKSEGHQEVVLGEKAIEILGQSGDYCLSITSNRGLVWGDTLEFNGCDAGHVGLKVTSASYIIFGDRLLGSILKNGKQGWFLNFKIGVEKGKLVFDVEKEALTVKKYLKS